MRIAPVVPNSTSADPCVCFSTCSGRAAAALLHRMPRAMTAASPWSGYLTTVYGSEQPRIPFALAQLRFFYHPTFAWRARHPRIEWPMARCICGHRSQAPRNADPLGALKDLSCWEAPGQRRCPAAQCNRWLPTLPDDNALPTAHRPPLVVLPVFVVNANIRGYKAPRGMPNASESAGMVITDGKGQNAKRTKACRESGQWMEVIRTHQTNLFPCSPEGVNYYGCWFFAVPGTGMWVSTGARTLCASRSTALSKLVPSWLAAQGLAHEKFTISGSGYKIAELTGRAQALVPAGALHGKEHFPFFARALGFDTVQSPFDNQGFSELIIAQDHCMLGRFALGTCPPRPLEVRMGWAAERPCVCRGEESGRFLLNCDGDAQGTEISASVGSLDT